MNSYQDLHDIIDLPRIIEDDIVPDSQAHIVYINNPMKRTSRSDFGGNPEFIPIVIPGFQWDYMWWIYRFMSQSQIETNDRLGPEDFTFPKFLNEYLEDVYRHYLKDKRGKKEDEEK